MRTLTSAQIESFLARPLLAVLATLRPDGSVLLSPVWHEWRDGGFNVILGRDDVKARHLAHDPRATIVVCEDQPPYAGVEARGAATLGGDDRELELRLAVRYLGEQGGRAYTEENAAPNVAMRIVPSALRAWDFAGEF